MISYIYKLEICGEGLAGFRALTYAQTKGLSGSPLFAEGGYAS